LRHYRVKWKTINELIIIFGMKNLSLISNILLAIAVVVLYALYFTGKGGNSSSNQADTTGNYSAKAGEIVYVEIDSLITNYDMFTDLKNELEKKGKEKEAQFNVKAKAFEKEAGDFQDKVQKGLVTRSQAEQMQQGLQVKQQEIYQLREQLRNEMGEEEQVMNRNVLNSIMEYLVVYNQDKKYSFVVSHSFGGPVLFADKGLNITKDVVVGLNDSYSKNKKESK